MIAYPAKFDRADDGITVTFPDIPEAITCGFSEPEAMEYAVDAIETMLSEYIKRRRDIPRASKARGKDVRMVVLPTLTEAKIRLYEAMREAGDQIEAALAKLHKRLAMHVEDMPRAMRAGA